MLIAYISPVDGKVAVIYPSDALPIEEVARKDVPAAVPYKFVEAMPEIEFSDAWVLDVSHPDGHGVGQEAWFIELYSGVQTTYRNEAANIQEDISRFEQALVAKMDEPDEIEAEDDNGKPIMVPNEKPTQLQVEQTREHFDKLLTTANHGAGEAQKVIEEMMQRLEAKNG